MKTIALCLVTSLLAGPASAVLYTNVTDGETLTVSANVDYTDTIPILTETGLEYGVNGTGSGVLEGAGNMTFNQRAHNTGNFDPELIGIQGSDIVISNYTGNLTVVNDISSLTINSLPAYAKSIVTGIVANTWGDLNGDLTVKAIAGTAISTGNAGAYAIATGIDGNLTGDIAGNITVSATAGTADSTGGDAYVFAQAVGINGNMTGNVTGDIVVTATDGTAVGPASNFYLTYASGIDGATIQIDQLTGNIIATAIAGKKINGGTTNSTTVTAYGIRSTSQLTLNATGGKLYAIIDAPNGMTPGAGSAAYAIMGGTGNDTVSLTDMDIIGDIDLRDGTNQLTISGNTRMEGDLLATGGSNNLLLGPGTFTPVGTVRIENLLNGQMTISSNTTLNMELYDDLNNPLNSKLDVDGNLIITDGASVAFLAGSGQTAANIIGNSYNPVTANSITGSLALSDQSMFDGSLSNNVYTPTAVKAQNGTSTPSGSSITKAVVTTGNVVMQNVSAHSTAIRHALRSPAGPEGPEGPSDADILTSGEWLMYVRQFNDIGSQDSDGALAGFDWTTSGFMIGAEKMPGEGFILGTAAGGAWVDIDGKKDAGGGKSDMFIANLYANWFSDTWYADAGIGYAHAWNDAQRIATDLQHYMGEYESDLYSAWLELGYTAEREKCNMEPYARATYISGNHNGYTDKGGTNPLTVDDNSTDNLLLEAGLRGRKKWEFDNGDQLSLDLKAGWQHELLDATVQASGSLLGVDQTLNSPSSSRDALALGAKLDWQVQDALVLSLEYAPTVSENWINHSLSAAVKFTF